jgi:hypothetical protein
VETVWCAACYFNRGLFLHDFDWSFEIGKRVARDRRYNKKQSEVLDSTSLGDFLLGSIGSFAPACAKTSTRSLKARLGVARVS